MDSLGIIHHAVTVNTDEDVAARIHSFSENGMIIVWVIVASGSVMDVVLREDISGVYIIHEGTFRILSLNMRYGCGLYISLVGNYGINIAGTVTGRLRAASPIQLIVGASSQTGVVPAATHAAATPAGEPSNTIPGQRSATVQIPFYQFFPDGTETESTVSRGGAVIPFYEFNI